LRTRKIPKKSHFDEESAAINLQPKPFAECTQVPLKLMAIGSVAFMAYGSAVPTAAIDVGVGVSGCATAASACANATNATAAIDVCATAASAYANATAAIDFCATAATAINGCATAADTTSANSTAANTASANSTSLTPDDMQSCVNPATGALNTGKLVETVVKLAGGGAFLVAAWIGIVGMHFPVGMDDFP
jgi:hypothetical protein